MNRCPSPVQSPDYDFASFSAAEGGIRMRYVMTPRFPERLYYNWRILSAWYLREGCLFQQGDPLFSVVFYNDWFPSLTRMSSTVHAKEAGILPPYLV